ncbi:MAG TPA: MOSC domain-containing protein [Pseudolabrys sp.]|nr:MOSC domain-containing protein [Pseudolabrys sp.]
MTDAILKDIYRYPVKGLSPQRLDMAVLAPGRTIAADRLYAIENGPIGFDPAHPVHFPKQRFLMLMRNDRLAALRTHYDEASHTLTVRKDGAETARGDLRNPEGRAAIETFFADYCTDELRGPPKVLSGEGAEGGPFSFSDVAKKVVSVINLGSVAEVETLTGAAVDPLRFRGNFYIAGWPAWHEFELLGRELKIGSDVRLKVVKRIVRCAATNVDPMTGIRDLNLPAALQRNLGHADCGVYAEVIAGGKITAGDTVASPA